MPVREDLLKPIDGENPSGIDIRYDTKLFLYDKIKEARREEDTLAQGEWKRERKLADWSLVSKLTQEALATRTKDLQLAAWLTDALLHTEGYAGLAQGLKLCHDLVSSFWETLYPLPEDGDAELRAAPLEWLGTSLEVPLKTVPLVHTGYGFLKYQESRRVGYEDQTQGEKEKKLRAQLVVEGKLQPEEFDKAFAGTPKAFYVQLEKDLDSCLASWKKLDEACGEKFGPASPSLSKLRTGLEEVRHTVHSLLQKKREKEPDPVEDPSLGENLQAAATADGPKSTAGPAVPAIVFSIMTSSEPPDRRDMIASVAKAAAFLRQREPFSPAAYLMMRGLRWGELRAAVQLGDATLLEAPPTELRQQVKRLALAKEWKGLLETAENAMALPCSRAWLDLQRHVVEACTGLGPEYEPIASAIRLELKVLMHDVPNLREATLLDDTPAANVETRVWIDKLMQRPAALAPDEPQAGIADGEKTTPTLPSISASAPEPSWPSKPADAYDVARAVLSSGQPEKAFEIMRQEIARQRAGRDRFQRTLQLVQLCVAAGKDAIAQPLLDDLMVAIETHKLDDWESRELVAAALATVLSVSKKVQANATEKQKLFERICRLDPVRALHAG